MKQKLHKTSRPRVTHFGTARIGDDISYDCAVLEDGRRGYILKTLRSAIGMRKNIPVPRFEHFCAEIAPNTLKYLEKSGSPFEVIMPHGGKAIWVEVGILPDLAADIVQAAVMGKLRKNRCHLIEPCLAIQKALSKVGEIALIDEATGYQYAREPDALQDLFARLIREKASDWQRRFHGDFYSAICRMLGFSYGNHHTALPAIVGKITMDWVYEVIFPAEIITQIKTRKKSEKLHQWLEDGGLKLLEKQRDAVMMIARVSSDYRDFEARCSIAFYKHGQQIKLAFP